VNGRPSTAEEDLWLPPEPPAVPTLILQQDREKAPELLLEGATNFGLAFSMKVVLLGTDEAAPGAPPQLKYRADYRLKVRNPCCGGNKGDYGHSMEGDKPICPLCGRKLPHSLHGYFREEGQRLSATYSRRKVHRRSTSLEDFIFWCRFYGYGDHEAILMGSTIFREVERFLTVAENLPPGEYSLGPSQEFTIELLPSSSAS